MQAPYLTLLELSTGGTHWVTVERHTLTEPTVWWRCTCGMEGTYSEEPDEADGEVWSEDPVGDAMAGGIAHALQDVDLARVAASKVWPVLR